MIYITFTNINRCHKQSYKAWCLFEPNQDLPIKAVHFSTMIVRRLESRKFRKKILRCQ